MKEYLQSIEGVDNHWLKIDFIQIFDEQTKV